MISDEDRRVFAEAVAEQERQIVSSVLGSFGVSPVMRGSVYALPGLLSSTRQPPTRLPDPVESISLYVDGQREPVGYVTVNSPAAPVTVPAAKSACRHDRREPVNLLVTGEHVADLCLDCDNQLPPA